MMNIKKIILLLSIILLISVPFAFAENGFDVPIGDNLFLKASFDNCTIINQEKIEPGNFTTLHNYTFHWENASKITYKNNEGKVDYFIVWQCNQSDEYYILYDLHDLTYHYSDYTADNTSVVYIENDRGSAYGILVDTQNISYSEDKLVHGILGLSSSYELTNSGYHNPPINLVDVSPHDYHKSNSLKGNQWDMAIKDPDWYYDHYDYGDNGEVDEYLYDYYYW